MKNVLLLVHADDGQESRVQCALDIVRAVGGHLNCLDVAATPILYEDYVTNYAQAIIIEDSIAIERENREQLEPRLVAEGFPYTWIETNGPIAQSVIDQSRLNDLIVVGSHGEKGMEIHGDVASAVVRRAGRPVLAVPHSARRIDLFGTALIAWDGSGPADSALRAAVPLLQHAESAFIVTVGDGDCDPTAAAAYCDRHGISAQFETVKRSSSIEETLLERARMRDAGFIVMGAYGHSPLREAIFGGVTRRMLESAPLPLFLAS